VYLSTGCLISGIEPERAMPTVELTKDNFEEVISNNDVVFVDFWASWCGPCKTFAPVFEATSEKYPDIVFGKVNTEEQAELAGAFDVRSIPTLMAVREKIILYSKPGAVPAHSLEGLIDRILAANMAQVRDEIENAQAEQPDSESTG
jgi:thioredoxin 1